MDSVRISTLRARAFNPDQHLLNVLESEWKPMFDEEGNPLVGIRGKEGAYGPRDMLGLVAESLGATKGDVARALSPLNHGGKEIDEMTEELGIDLIEMEPGANFPLHRHPGDHILIGIQGAGTIRVDGYAHPMWPGQTVFVAAEQEHGVGTHQSLRSISMDWIKSREAFASSQLFMFYAIGVPHKHVSASDRMLLVDDPGAARDRLAREG